MKFEQMSNYWNRKVLGIRVWQALSLLLFYAFFGVAYHLVLYLTSQGTASVFPHAYLDYTLKMLLTIPVWYLLFKTCAHWSIPQKIFLHIVLLQIWLVLWQQSYYFILEYLDEGHLRGSATWWDIYIPGLFYLLQFGVFHLYDFYVKLQNQHELEKDLRASALKSELTALKAQLNPHFLYNTFNTINASLPKEQESTRELIAGLADMFRYQLRGSKQDLVKLEDEIEFVSKYLELEKARFGDRLTITYDIDQGVKEAQIPPMILQPIVENAVKHGISPKVDGGEISISAKKDGNKIAIKICDTGVGIQKEKEVSQGIGLTNTKLRLEKLYKSELNLFPSEKGGVCVQFEIPAA